VEDTEVLRHLHPELIPSLSLLPTDKPVTLLTRHSIREQPGNGFAGYDIPLTPEGVELAKQWGRNITRPIAGIYSSPVDRCVKTAEAMAQGAGVELPVHTDSTLVEPGSYVQDLPVAGPYFMKLGPLAFAKKHLRNEVRGVLSPGEGAQRLLEHLRLAQGPDGSISLHVTHDTILASFIYYLRRESELDEEHWPWMMEGAFLWFQDSSVNWIWRGEHGIYELSV